MTDIKANAAFTIGAVIGMMVGLFVFGISMIGQNLWDEGRAWGEQLCNARTEMDGATK